MLRFGYSISRSSSRCHMKASDVNIDSRQSLVFLFYRFLVDICLSVTLLFMTLIADDLFLDVTDLVLIVA